MTELTSMQVRVLGCLMEKKESTPDQYPLTLNSLRNACNQKSSRFPVVNFSEGEVGHTLRELEALDLVREDWGARAAKYGHLVNRTFHLHSKGIALLCVLMLRGPQTLNELKIHSHRLFDFEDLEEVQFVLDHLIANEPSFATALPRQTGQKEGRYAHLLSGEPDIPEAPAALGSSAASTGLTARVAELEAELEEVRSRLFAIEEKMN